MEQVDVIPSNLSDGEVTVGAFVDSLQNSNYESPTILMNYAAMANASKEYVIAVLIHEIFHAINANHQEFPRRSEYDEHKYMVENQLKDIKDWIKDVTGLSDNESACLAIQGFDEVKKRQPSVFETSIKSAFGQNFDMTQINTIVNDYANKTKGKGICE